MTAQELASALATMPDREANDNLLAAIASEVVEIRQTCKGCKELITLLRMATDRGFVLERDDHGELIHLTITSPNGDSYEWLGKLVQPN